MEQPLCVNYALRGFSLRKTAEFRANIFENYKKNLHTGHFREKWKYFFKKHTVSI